LSAHPESDLKRNIPGLKPDDDSDEAPGRSVSPSPRRQDAVFESVFADRELFKDFSKFLVSIQAGAGLEFYLAVEQWRKSDFTDVSDSNQQTLFTSAQLIFNKYLSLQSPQCLTVLDEHRNMVQRALKAGKIPISHKLFDQAFAEVVFQLRGHFVAFKAQPVK
jgi:hypothetical protein